ncbi:MAG: hypothetical protein MPL62_18205 [Alphaproteobacteria bacterium]|nr:hypothetical protein [Alphaproteobacteria bacterium]
MAKPKRKNPIFPRWHDPFFGTNRDYLAGKGGGDPAKGYDMILVQAIEDWNATAEKRGLPKTSKEHGMEWVPTAKRDKDGKLAGFRRLTEKELKEMNFYGD